VLPNTLPLDTTPPPWLPDDLARASMVFVRRDGHEPPLQPLYDGPYAVVRRSHRRQGGQGVYPQTQAMHGSCSAAGAAQGRGRPPAAVRFRDFPPPGAVAARRVHFAPEFTSRTAPGTVFPWHAARGFCTPRRCSRPHRRSARSPPPSAVKIRPLGLRPRGLGGAL
jgi:hypothetical protein